MENNMKEMGRATRSKRTWMCALLGATLMGLTTEVGNEEEKRLVGRRVVVPSGAETEITAGIPHAQVTINLPTSAGMTLETTHLFAASDLTRKNQGGGTEVEDITVRHVPLAELDTWLHEREASGLLIDFKIHACLWLARQHGLLPPGPATPC